MNRPLSLRLAGFVLASCATFSFAQDKPAQFEPQPGQQGKDVIWLPTPQAVVDKMVEVANVGPSDFVMDLGSGDGRTVIAAARRGATAVGIEYNPDMVEYGRRAAEKAGVSARTSFTKADLFETDLSKATVITMFLLPDINLRLRPKILDLKPGTRIVSNTFTMGDWEPDVRVELNGQPGCDNSYCTVLHWVVPRKVAGTHKVQMGEVTLSQEYQKLTGTLKTGGGNVALQGRVRGEDIELSGGGKKYRGRMKGRELDLREAG